MLNTSTKEGRLTRDPNVKVYNNRAQNGQQYQQIVAYFTIASDRNFKNRQNRYDADFFKCVVKGSPANYLANVVHVRKGDQILIHGSERAGRNDAYTSNKYFNNQGRPARIPQSYILVTSRNGYVHLESHAYSHQGQPQGNNPMNQPMPNNQGYPQQPNGYPQNNMNQPYPNQPQGMPSNPMQQPQRQMRRNWPHTPFDNRPQQRQGQPMRPQNQRNIPNQQPNNRSSLHITNTNANQGQTNPNVNPMGKQPMTKPTTTAPQSSMAFNTKPQSNGNGNASTNNTAPSSKVSPRASSASNATSYGKKLYKSDSDLPF